MLRPLMRGGESVVCIKRTEFRFDDMCQASLSDRMSLGNHAI